MSEAWYPFRYLKALKKILHFQFFSLQKLNFVSVVAILHELRTSSACFHRRYFEHIMHKYKKSFLLSLDDNFKRIYLWQCTQIIFKQIQ